MSYEIDQIQEALHKAVAQVTEGMAFAEIETCQRMDDMPVFSRDDFLATLNIKKPFDAIFGLIVNQKFLNSILQTTVEENRDDDLESLAGDLISEFTNTIAGCFMTFLLPPDREFEIDLPESGDGQDRKQKLVGFSSDIILDFIVEFNHIYCFFSYKNGCK